MSNTDTPKNQFQREVRVRFAPSPTGDLHVGGVRTALFNWLFARHNNGKFLLRIEDTDRKRSTKEAIQVILDGLNWLGIDHDEDVMYQSTRIDQHREAAHQLLEEGKAYRCFCTKDELARSREEKKIYIYDRKCLHLSAEEIEQKLSDGIPYAVRLKVPDENIQFNDQVHGNISVAGKEIEDFVLLRSDGTPTYMIAVVIDDKDLGITHIIRGDDHISNTPKQILLYRALGYDVPEFAHVPLIMGPDKKRLSKRHGATSITEYRTKGYLLDTMINYLGMLGWSPGDDRDKISRKELIDEFSISGINPRNAVFDEEKLRWLNGLYIGELQFDQVKDELFQYSKDAFKEGILNEEPDISEIETAWNMLKNRIHILPELYTWGNYFFQDPLSFDAKGVRKQLSGEDVVEKLSVIVQKMQELPGFTVEDLEQLIRTQAEEWEISAGKLIHPLRLAVSGETRGPGLFELLEALGKDVVVSRVKRIIGYIETNSIPLDKTNKK